MRRPGRTDGSPTTWGASPGLTDLRVRTTRRALPVPHFFTKRPHSGHAPLCRSAGPMVSNVADERRGPQHGRVSPGFGLYPPSPRLMTVASQ